MRTRVFLVVASVVAAVAMGATVFREDVADAAGQLPTILVANDPQRAVPVREQNLDAGGNIKVHEQGTADVRVNNTVASADVDVRTAVRFGPEAYNTIGGGLQKVLIPRDAVPAGKKFIVAYLNITGFSLISSSDLADGFCFTRVLSTTTRDGQVIETSSPFISVPLMPNGGELLAGSEPAFLPLNSGEGLAFACSGETATGERPSSEFLMTVGGYFVSTP